MGCVLVCTGPCVISCSWPEKETILTLMEVNVQQCNTQAFLLDLQISKKHFVKMVSPSMTADLIRR